MPRLRGTGPADLYVCGVDLQGIRVLHHRLPEAVVLRRRGPWAVLLLGMLALPSGAWCWTLLAAPSPLAQGAASAPAATLQAEAGWAGWIPLNAWLPVHVDLQVSIPVDGAVVVDVPVPGYDAPLSFRRPVRLL